MSQQMLPETVKFRSLVDQIKATGKNLTWIASVLKVHHQTAASWNCGQRRVPVARLEQLAQLAALQKGR